MQTSPSPTWSSPANAHIDATQESIEERCFTLLDRYYERFADHAVSVARRVVFLVTGEREMHAAADTP